jgi:Nucleotidyl transferase AbiEii toxin, Type IV TA system/N-terminal domain of anti-restriction factor ArdC
MKVEEVKQITNKALEELAASLKSGHSEALTAYLKTMALFLKYSLNNLFLIARQRPDARRVAGYQTWRKLGRYVRKGEKGIATNDQAEILQTCAGKLGRRPEHLEKDVWICWVLQGLFTMPGRLPMAFKGGTSLSKAYAAIQRFSEDVDVTVDCKYERLSFFIDFTRKSFCSGI